MRACVCACVRACVRVCEHFVTVLLFSFCSLILSPHPSPLTLSLSNPQDYGDKRITLYDIRDELSSPYKERRTPYTPLSGEEKFILLTGETPDSLYEGKLLTCTVVGIVRRKTLREVLDRANPIKNERTLLWQCPFCLQSDFRDLSLVSASTYRPCYQIFPSCCVFMIACSILQK